MPMFYFHIQKPHELIKDNETGHKSINLAFGPMQIRTCALICAAGSHFAGSSQARQPLSFAHRGL
jgi:hypothetical protein